jgi:NADH-quinone oxidoreductase subunit C
VSVDEAPAVPDATCQRFLQSLQADLGEKLLASVIQNRDLIVRVDARAWVDAAIAARKAGATHFGFLSGLDWLENPAQTTRYENVWGTVEESDDASDREEAALAVAAEGEEAAAPEAAADDAASAPGRAFRTGLAGGESRFQVFARFVSVTECRGIVVKADLDEAAPSVATISNVFAGANWHERESWEMFGFDFPGHPNLVHLYLPGAFEGFPLRKDFPLLAREVKPWPGLTNVEPISGEAETEEADA